MEARAGIEPTYGDLQSPAWPLCHRARNRAWRERRPGPCLEGAESNLRGIAGSRLGRAADSRRSRRFPGPGCTHPLVIDIDLNKKNDARINELLAHMLEIDRDPITDRRLHLSQSPGRTIGMAHIHAGHQLMAQGS
jgi:hypothetical protein